MIKWFEKSGKIIMECTKRGITTNDAFDKVSYLISHKKHTTPELQNAARRINIAFEEHVKPENFYTVLHETNFFQGLEKDLIIEALNVYLNATDEVNKLYDKYSEMITYCINITGESKEV